MSSFVNVHGNHHLRLLIALCASILACACSATPYRTDSSVQADIESRANQLTHGDFTVRASVPGNDEARALFGIPLHKRGIQAVWLEISSESSRRARFAPYSVDPDYFPPYEVAYMHRKRFSKQGHADMETHLSEISLPRNIQPGEVVSGYVFTNATIGTKAFNVDIHYTGGAAKHEHFTFFVNVPGFVPDHAEVNFEEIYTPEEIAGDLSADEFRKKLETLPCCSRNRADTADGRPLTTFLVANGRDLLQVLLRAGWSETSYERDDKYLNLANYYFGRPPDAVFRRGRDKVTERIELGLWLMPFRVEGKLVWAVQSRNAIGRILEIGHNFLGVRLDPNADEGRNFLLQNLWYSQSLASMAWSNTGMEVSSEDPKSDFSGNIWFSDGFRLVAWLSGEPISYLEAEFRDWDQVVRRRRPQTID